MLSLITFANSFGPRSGLIFVRPALDQNCLPLRCYSWKFFLKKNCRQQKTWKITQHAKIYCAGSYEDFSSEMHHGLTIMRDSLSSFLGTVSRDTKYLYSNIGVSDISPCTGPFRLWKILTTYDLEFKTIKIATKSQCHQPQMFCGTLKVKSKMHH